MVIPFALIAVSNCASLGTDSTRFGSFTVGVFEHEFLLGLGKASSIKEAGRMAAREALEILREQEEV